MIAQSLIPTRVLLVDIGRSTALLAMVVYHFNYDLALFGLSAPGTMAQPFWIWMARSIAGSFIFLSGISLVLAAGQGPVNWSKTGKRLAMIGGAAALVTVGTYFAIGPAFVRFGILHHMFAATLIGFLVLRLPALLLAGLGVATLTLPLTVSWPVLDGTQWLWLARTSTMPAMVDFFPILPWIGLFFLGMASAKALHHAGLWPRIAALTDPVTRGRRLLAWPGQHSLAIYLIHQPILFGLLILYTSVLR